MFYMYIIIYIKETMPSMSLGAETLNWVAEIKYHEISLYSKQGIRVNIDISC